MKENNSNLSSKMTLKKYDASQVCRCILVIPALRSLRQEYLQILSWRPTWATHRESLFKKKKKRGSERGRKEGRQAGRKEGGLRV
jgi:predicted transposase YdaD